MKENVSSKVLPRSRDKHPKVLRPPLEAEKDPNYFCRQINNLLLTGRLVLE